MRTEIFVDYSWLYHKSFHTFSDLSFVHEGKTYLTGALYGAVRDIAILKEKFPESPIFVAIEPEDNSSRHMMHESYKQNRPKKDPAMMELINETTRALTLIPGVTVWSSDQAGEADDVLYTLIKERKSQFDCAMVYALDNDLLQVAGDIDLAGKCFYAKLKDAAVPFEGYCSEKYDVHPRDLVLYRALIGDSSDNLKGPVPRFPRALARKLLESRTFNPDPAADLIAHINATPLEEFELSEQKWIAALREKADILIKNYKMMKLHSLKLTDMTSYFRDPQKDVEYFVRTYGLNTLQKIKDGTFRRPTDEGSASHFNPNRPY